MASITIRNLEEKTKKILRVRAAGNGRSLEAEARAILKSAAEASDTREKPQIGLGEAIRRRFAPLGGVEIPLPVRRGRKLPDFR